MWLLCYVFKNHYLPLTQCVQKEPYCDTCSKYDTHCQNFSSIMTSETNIFNSTFPFSKGFVEEFINFSMWNKTWEASLVLFPRPQYIFFVFVKGDIAILSSVMLVTLKQSTKFTELPASFAFFFFWLLLLLFILESKV